MKIQIHEHGWLELDSYTSDYNDYDAARFARESTTADNKSPEKDEKLIEYLLKNGHVSPLDHIFLVFRAELPIFVMRQWVRHNSLRFNEYSLRYSEMIDKFYMPGGITVDQKKSISDAYIVARDSYAQLLESGMPKELARIVLPVGQYTRMSVSGTLRNWLYGFLRQRLDHHAQAEIRAYAVALAAIVRNKYPVIFDLWFKHGFDKIKSGIMDEIDAVKICEK